MLDTISTLGVWGATNDIYMEMYKDNSHKTREHPHYIMKQRLLTADPIIVLVGNDSSYEQTKYFLTHLFTIYIYSQNVLFGVDYLILIH